MHVPRRSAVLTACIWFGLAFTPLAAQAPQTAPASSGESAKIWLENRSEIEEYLRTAKVVKLEDIGTGVTNPKRAELEPGGPVAAMAWKPIRPGRYNGFWESYKAEIAAYELDKMLDLNMVPPTVEKRIRGDLGAAVMWATPTKSFGELGGPPSAPPAHFTSWNLQIIRAKMFDNLIHNRDPNLGNWLVDPAWNLILIDHTRAFTVGRNIVHEMTRIDVNLWERMQALTEESLTAAIGSWLSRGEIRSIVQRRDRMREIIDKMVAERGAAAVFVR